MLNHVTAVLPQATLEQQLAAKDKEIAALREKLSQQQLAGTTISAHQSRHSLRMAQNANINLKVSLICRA